MKDKINCLFIPFLFVFLGLMLAYTFLNWLLFIKFEIFSVETFILNFLVPVCLTGIFAWFILRRRFKILKLTVRKGDWTNFYSFMLWIILSIPLVISQEYLISASGKLKELNSIKDINKSRIEKYYTLKNHFIDKTALGIHTDITVTGKRNTNYNMHWYIAVPIFESPEDTVLRQVRPLAWVGIQYNKTIRNNLSQTEKNRTYQEFATESQASFALEDFTDFSYLARMKYADVEDDFLIAVGKNPYYYPSDLLFTMVHQPFELRNGNKLNWIAGMIIFGSFVWFIMLSIPEINRRELKRFKTDKKNVISKFRL
ncbi:MAG: hypothetical protein PHQ74_03785 [Crocinitomicaceae bacterium]|nr:hypothetical protein [Crocinitomicaceae bacterium]